MNRQEALEWAADWLERYKIFDGASLQPAARLEMISTLADSVVIEEEKETPIFFANPECTGFIQACASKMKLASSRPYKLALKNAIDSHCWHLAGQAPANEPHPEHIIPPDPDEDVAEADEPAVTSSPRKASKTY